MKTKKFTLLSIGYLMLTSCASTHPGREGRTLQSDPVLPIKISAQTIDEDSEKALQLVEVTIENTSDTWLRIYKTEVLILNPSESKLSVVAGNDLQSWSQSMAKKLEQDDANRQLLQIGLTVVSLSAAVAGVTSNDSTLTNVGLAGLIGTSAWAVADTIRSAQQKAEQTNKFPESHLYREYSVPSKMIQRRWVLLNKPVNTLIKNLVIKFETVDGVQESYEMEL